MYYQEINEILAKGLKTDNMTHDQSTCISEANKYLTERIGSKPEWMDEFLESNKCKLIETICRATSNSNNISSLLGYNEGYFNEIVQNVNDLHCGNEIEISVSNNNGRCELICQYSDNGFKLSNIYAFLNREMSDKSDKLGQTGKFGVGIKSFFLFVERLKVESNIIFDFKIERNGDLKITGETYINNYWKKGKTNFSVTYNPNCKSDFNTKKLTNLISCLCEEKCDNILDFFLNENDNELIFDINSFLFINMNSEDRAVISKLKIQGSKHYVEILCKEEYGIDSINYSDTLWRIKVLKNEIVLDNSVKYSEKFLVFSNNNISSAFPIGNYSKLHNRVYSTYYLKSDNKLLPIGMLIDSKYTNIHRNDVGDNEEKINDFYNTIIEYMRCLYRFMCSDIVNSLPCSENISDVFHSILARYLVEITDKYPESPLNCADFDNKKMHKLNNSNVRSYVVVHSDKEEYSKCSHQEGNIKKELEENYFEFVEANNVYDIKDVISEDGINGVKRVYSLLHNDLSVIPEKNIDTASRILNFFGSVKEFLVYVISGERTECCKVTDSDIDNWLIRLKGKIGNYFNPQYFLKIIGRYCINDAIKYDGSISSSNLSFKDYLFNDALAAENGILTKYQNEYFDEKYFKLKEELLKKRYVDIGNTNNSFMIRCIYPYSYSKSRWDGEYSYFNMELYDDVLQPLSQSHLLLERMAMDPKFTGILLYANRLRIFQAEARGMWQREFEYYKILQQQIIDISCMRKINLYSFSDFIAAIKHRKKLKEEFRNFIKIACIEKKITTKSIAESILPVITDIPNGEKTTYLLDEFEPSDVMIDSIIEDSNNEMPVENIEFIYKLTGYKVHVYRFNSNTKRKIVAYFGDGYGVVKPESSYKFRRIIQYNSSDKNIYIFYDNAGTDLQKIVNSVLENLTISLQNLTILNGYIHNGNTTKTMDYISRRRNFAKIRKKLFLNWSDVDTSNLTTVNDIEILYRLLTARGCYDVYCPICADIPLEAFDYGADTKKKHSRQIVLFENTNTNTKHQIPYIITLACEYCSQRLRNTLISSEFEGDTLILTTQISHGQHEKSKQELQIKLAPINVEIIKKFKLFHK